MSRPKPDRPPLGQHISSSSHTGGSSGSGTGSGTGGNEQNKLISGNPHIRSSMSGSTGSSGSNQFKSRPHSMPQSGQISKDRHSMANNSNGSSHGSHGNSIKGDFKHDKMKINPAPIGLVNNASGNQVDMLRKQQSQQSSHLHGSNQKHPHAPYMKHSSSRSSMPPHMKQQQQQQSLISSSVNQQNKLLPAQPATQQMSQPSFSLLDESALSSESLRTSPTADNKQKQSSIFSPEYMSTSVSAASATSTPLTVPPPRSSGGNNNNNSHKSNNSNLNSFNKISGSENSKKSLPPSLLMNTVSNESHIDFLKQEKIGNEPPQQLLASVKVEDMKSESKKRPIEDVQMPDFNKMRRLEARLEGLPPDMMPPEELLAPIAPKPEPLLVPKKERLEPVDPYSSSTPVLHIPDILKAARVVIPKLEKDERLVNRLNRPLHDPTVGHVPSQIIGLPNMTDVAKLKSSLPVNGIETNPAAISSLLKESLFSDNSKHNSILPITDTPGSQLLNDSTPASGVPGYSNHQNTSLNTGVPVGVGSGTGSAGLTNAGSLGGHQDLMGDYHHKSKSEKKKKKEKHKHKERSKDKEERKKHKKDKDRHRDKSKERHRDSHSVTSLIHPDADMISVGGNHPGHATPIQQHVKLTIKNAPGEGSGSLKIKIPKEKIKPPESELPKLPPLKIPLKGLLQPQPSSNKS